MFPRTDRGPRWLPAATVLLLVLPLAFTRAWAQEPAPTVLSGTGSWGVAPEMRDWAASLGRGPSPVDLRYLPTGSQAGRTAFIRGEADFVVSGVGFTPAEEAELSRAGRGYVAVPLQATALALLLRPPVDGLLAAGSPPQPYRGPVRMPAGTVARSVLRVGNAWADPAFGQATGVTLQPCPSPPEPVLRGDPTAENLYLGQYLSTVAPDVWRAGLAAAKVPGAAAPDRSEAWPTPAPALRSGVPGVVDAVANDASPGGGPAQGGNLGAVPPWAVKDARARFPGMDLRVVELWNGAGEWVGPTPEAVAAAVVSGRGAPLAGLSAPAAGAYPLAWVDHLYAPKTLAPERARALVALIRHAAGEGRSGAATHGDAPLPDFLATEALQAADELERACACPAVSAPGPPPKTDEGAPSDPVASLAPQAAGPAVPLGPAPAPGPLGPPEGSAILPFGDLVQLAPEAPDGPAPQDSPVRPRARTGSSAIVAMSASAAASPPWGLPALGMLAAGCWALVRRARRVIRR